MNGSRLFFATRRLIGRQAISGLWVEGHRCTQPFGQRQILDGLTNAKRLSRSSAEYSAIAVE